MALPSDPMPGRCTAYKFFSDRILNVVNNAAVICDGDKGVVSGSNIVRQWWRSLSLERERSVIMCVSSLSLVFVSGSCIVPCFSAKK